MPDPVTLGPAVYAALTATATVTGFIDAIAGGGGLIMMPALIYAGLPPHVVLGTNKLQSVCGTSMALRNYRKAGLVTIRPNLATVGAVLLGAGAGAAVIQRFSADVLRLIVPLLLMAVALYTLLSRRMDDHDRESRLSEPAYRPLAAAIGFYDGFFGPGTGQFFAATQVSLRGLGLTRATAMTKLLNVTSNAASLVVFALGGQVLWLLGLCMAAGAMTGAWIGSHTAARFGARLIRPLLVAASLCLTAKLVWDWFRG